MSKPYTLNSERGLKRTAGLEKYAAGGLAGCEPATIRGEQVVTQATAKHPHSPSKQVVNLQQLRRLFNFGVLFLPPSEM